MAHIKVTRRGMSPEEWLELRFIRLKRNIYSDKEEIDTFTIRDARQTAEMEYEFYDGAPTDQLRQILAGKLWTIDQHKDKALISEECALRFIHQVLESNRNAE